MHGLGTLFWEGVDILKYIFSVRRNRCMERWNLIWKWILEKLKKKHTLQIHAMGENFSGGINFQGFLCSCESERYEKGKATADRFQCKNLTIYARGGAHFFIAMLQPIGLIQISETLVENKLFWGWVRTLQLSERSLGAKFFMRCLSRDIFLKVKRANMESRNLGL